MSNRFIPARCLRKYDIQMFKYLLTHSEEVALEKVLKNGNLKYYYFKLYDRMNDSQRNFQVEEVKVVVKRKRADKTVTRHAKILYTYTTEDDSVNNPEIRKEVSTIVESTVDRIVSLISVYGYLFSYSDSLMLTNSQYYSNI